MDHATNLPVALCGFALCLTPEVAAAVLQRYCHLPVPLVKFFLVVGVLLGSSHLPDSIIILAWLPGGGIRWGRRDE